MIKLTDPHTPARDATIYSAMALQPDINLHIPATVQ